MSYAFLFSAVDVLIGVMRFAMRQHAKASGSMKELNIRSVVMINKAQ